MANKLILTYNSTYEETTEVGAEIFSSGIKNHLVSRFFTLLDMVQIENISEYFSLSTVCPELSRLVTIAGKASAGITGGIGGGLLDFTNIMDAPIWQNTKPLSIVLKLGLFTETDAYKDVWKPSIDLIGMSILTKQPNGQYLAPGLNLNNLKDFMGGAKKKADAEEQFMGAKLVSIDIPGVVYIPVAVVNRVTPTYSKQITDQGYPLWVDLDCQFTGTIPATTEFYEASHPDDVKKRIINNIYNGI
jgi:hypothetical protein